MSDRNALLQGVIAEPADDAVRLIFADWLDDHNEADLAELIRTQIRLAAMNPWDAGYTSLDVRSRCLARAHPEWLDEARGLLSNTQRFCGERDNPFDRGFLTRVELTPTELAKNQHLFHQHPITQVEFSIHARHSVKRLSKLILQRLRHVDFVSLGDPGGQKDLLPMLRRLGPLDHFGLLASPVTESCMTEVFASPAVSPVRSLRINGKNFTSTTEAAFSHAPWPNLRRLNQTSIRSLDWLRSAWVGPLTGLTLSDAEHLDPDERRLLGDVLPGTDIQQLRLSWWTLDVGGIEALASALPRSRVRSLALPIFRGGPIRSLFTPEMLAQLRALYISAADLDAEVVGRLAGTGLRVCALSYMNVEALPGLIRQPGLPELEELRLCLVQNNGNIMPLADQLRAVLDAGMFPRLTSLWVYDTTPGIGTKHRIGDALAVALAQSPGVASLRFLRLGEALTGIGAQALAESPYLDQIEAIDARIYPADPDAERMLIERFGTSVYLGSVNIEF